MFSPQMISQVETPEEQVAPRKLDGNLSLKATLQR